MLFKTINKIHADFCDYAIPVQEDAGKINLVVPESTDNGYFELHFELPGMTGNEYVLFPACCYNGNRFRVIKHTYPLIFTKENASPDMEVTISDVPRLNTDGSGEIEVTTGDVAVPCVGVFSQKTKKATLIFVTQGIDGINFGLSYRTGCVTVSYPHMRKKKMYRHCVMLDSTDKGMTFQKDETVSIPYRVIEFDCDSIHKFYRVFFENRKCMGMDAAYSKALPVGEMWKVHEEKYNRYNWREKEGFYAVGIDKIWHQYWQPGWTGGAINSFPMMKLGGDLSYQRGLSTLRFLFSTQSKAGFFIGGIGAGGETYGDFFGGDGTVYKDGHLLRKSADVLYFLFKHFRVMDEKGEPIPSEFIDGTRKLADAFVTLWERYGQLGQFVDLQTGDILAGNSTSAAIASAGLAHSWRFFGDERYLKTAKEIAEQYYTRDLSSGYTTGGPGEAAQCPDSESAFGLLESFVVLYDFTKEEKWLEYARASAAFCSSWIVSYNYKFPSRSEFNRLGMKTIGSVFANVQNKHSAPGICTLSGDSLYELYKFTGDPLYLELIRDIARNIFQYVSRKDRPVYSWDTPPQRLTDGAMSERVNMSDWEDYAYIGEVFNGSCWCEASSMLILAEMGSNPDIFES